MTTLRKTGREGNEPRHWLNEGKDRRWLINAYIMIGAIVLGGAIFPFLKIHPGLAFTKPYLLYPLFMFLLLTMGLLLLVPKWPELRELLVANPLLLALIGWMLASLAWTVAPHDRIKVLAALLTSTIYGFHLVLYRPRRALLRLLGLVALTVLGGSLVYTYYFHTMSFAPATPKAMAGLFSNKNIAVRLASFALILSAFLLSWQNGQLRQGTSSPSKNTFPLRVAWTLLILVSLWMMVRYYSFTAKFTLAAVIAGSALAFSARAGRRALLLTSLALAVLVVLAALSFNRIISMARETSGLHNRLYHWSQMITQHETSHWFGAGLGGFWNRDEGPWRHLDLLAPLNHGHNGFIDTWLDLGFIGLFLVLANIALVIWRYARRPFSRWHPLHFFTAATFMVFIIYNITESSLLPTNSANTLMWAIFVALTLCSVSEEAKKPRGFDHEHQQTPSH